MPTVRRLIGLTLLLLGSACSGPTEPSTPQPDQGGDKPDSKTGTGMVALALRPSLEAIAGNTGR
jgi:hypothetical protein